MPNAFPRRGLYAITPDHLRGDALYLAVRAAIAGGAAAIQYRAKPVPDSVTAERLLALCRSAGIPFIINDAVQLARSLGADGVHIGKTDSDVAAARIALGDTAIVGLSCYGSVPAAVEAQAVGASYVAFGRFFPSITKPQAAPTDASVLAEARQRLSIPIVAIGGITPNNAAPLLQAGADVVAAIHSVFGAGDPHGAASTFQAVFTEYG